MADFQPPEKINLYYHWRHGGVIIRVVLGRKEGGEGSIDTREHFPPLKPRAVPRRENNDGQLPDAIFWGKKNEKKYPVFDSPIPNNERRKYKVRY